jgi:hypothetical protein
MADRVIEELDEAESLRLTSVMTSSLMVFTKSIVKTSVR